jgi:thioredoxin 1
MIEDRDAYDELLEKHKDDNVFLVFKFGAEWCGPCKRIDPYYKEYKELSLERGVAVEFHYLDIDEESIMDLMSDDLDLKLVPHFLIVRNGEVVSTLQTSQRDALFEFLDTYLI